VIKGNYFLDDKFGLNIEIDEKWAGPSYNQKNDYKVDF